MVLLICEAATNEKPNYITEINEILCIHTYSITISKCN